MGIGGRGKVTVNHYPPFDGFRLFLCGLVCVLQKCFLWNETQNRMDAYPSVPLAVVDPWGGYG